MSSITNDMVKEILKGCTIIRVNSLDEGKQVIEKYKNSKKISTVNCGFLEEGETEAKILFGTESMGEWATLLPIAGLQPPCNWYKNFGRLNSEDTSKTYFERFEAGYGESKDRISPIIPDIIIVRDFSIDTVGGAGLLLGYCNLEEEDFWDSIAIMQNLKFQQPYINLMKVNVMKKYLAWFCEFQNHPEWTANSNLSGDVSKNMTEAFIVLDLIMKNDKEMIEAGIEWFNKGCSINETKEEKKDTVINNWKKGGN